MNEPLTIWIFNPFDDVPVEGQPQRYWTLAAELSKRGHKVVWWSSKFSHRRKVERRLGNKASELPFKLRLVACRPYFKNVSIARVLNHRDWGRVLVRNALDAVASGELVQPDVIYASSPPLEGPTAALRLKASFGCKVVTDIMDAWPDTLLQAIPGIESYARIASVLFLPYRRMLARSMKESDAVVAQSEAFAQYAKQNGWSGDSHISYLGASANCAASLFPEVSMRQFVYLGAMGRSYDLENLIKAVIHLEEEGCKLRLHIAGEGEKLNALKILSKGSDAVCFHGFLQEDALASLLRRVDVGVIPMFDRSRVAVPYKAGDYLASGLPIINSLNGEMNSMLNDYCCGTHYNAGDIDSLLDALRAYLEMDREVLVEQKKNASRLFVEKFDRDKIYAELARYIELV